MDRTAANWRPRQAHARLAVAAVAIGVALAMGTATADARTFLNVTSSQCALNPGDTTITWDPWGGGTALDLNWIDGSVVVEHVLLRPTPRMNGIYAHPTPAGATGFTWVVIIDGKTVGGMGMDCT